jgi:hypothetical protein
MQVANVLQQKRQQVEYLDKSSNVKALLSLMHDNLVKNVLLPVPLLVLAPILQSQETCS